MPTQFDWRVGVLGGEPLFACQYKMARGHWQIAKQEKDGGLSFGGVSTIAVEDAPKAVIEAAVKAARLIGDGLYGIDLKENDRGVFVIEVNDNPNLDHDDEGEVLKDELWRRIIKWFEGRLEKRMGGAAAAPLVPVSAAVTPLFAKAGAK
jgi:glutathione synthase/RimK-type ligase-like ATP-grasp enzyme